MKLKLKKKNLIADRAHKTAGGLLKAFVPASQIQLERDIERNRKMEEAKRKRIRIDIEALGQGCERCLSKKAKVYSPIFEMKLCDECEENLEMNVAAETLERRKVLKR